MSGMIAPTLEQRLCDIRAAIGGKLVKEKKPGLKYQFIGHEQVVSLIRPLMDEHHVILLAEITDCRTETRQTPGQDGGIIFNTVIVLKCRFTWACADDPSQRIVQEFAGFGVDRGEQALGKAFTYAHKEYLKKVLLLGCDDDDPDVITNRRHEQRQQASQNTGPAARPARPPAQAPSQGSTPGPAMHPAATPGGTVNGGDILNGPATAAIGGAVKAVGNMRDEFDAYCGDNGISQRPYKRSGLAAVVNWFAGIGPDVHTKLIEQLISAGVVWAPDELRASAA